MFFQALEELIRTLRAIKALEVFIRVLRALQAS